MAMGAVKTKRFLSRMMAEINEVKMSATNTPTEDLDEDVAREFGAGVAQRTATANIIKERAKEAELMRDHGKNVYKAFHASMVALAAYRESLKAATKTLKDFHDDLETGNDTDLLKASLALLVKTTEATNGALLNLGEITDHHVVQPILNFVKKDVRDARYFTHEVLKVQVDYEGALRTLNQAKKASKKASADPKKYATAVSDFTALQGKFDQVAQEAQSKHQRLQETNCIDNALRFIEFGRTQHLVLRDGAATLEPLSAQLGSNEAALLKRQNERDQRQNDVARSLIAEETRKLDVHYDAFLSIMGRPPLVALAALYESLPLEEGEATVGSLVRVLHSRNAVVPTFVKLIRADVRMDRSTSVEWSPRPLFVNQPVAAKLLSSYVRQYAKLYMVAVVGPIVRSVSRDTTVLEIDPSKALAGDAAGNGGRLVALFNDLVTAITGSKALCPLPLRMLAREVWAAGGENADAKRLIGYDAAADVVGFLFLRLFVPALASPAAFGIMQEEEMTPAARRTLLYLSNLLKNVVLKAHAPLVEAFWDTLEPSPYMFFPSLLDFANDFVESHQSTVTWPSPTAASSGSGAGTISAASYDILTRQQDLDPLVARVERGAAKIYSMMAQTGQQELALELGTALKALSRPQDKVKAPAGVTADKIRLVSD